MGKPEPLHDALIADSLLLTSKEAAKVLRVGRTTIYALMKAGELHAVHIGRSCRISLALAVGLRQSEVLGLRWTDVDLENGTLSIRRGLHRVGGQGLVHEEPKAEGRRRTVALPKQLVEALVTHRAAQREERMAAGPLWEENHLAFAQPNGRPIERKWPPHRRDPAAVRGRAPQGRHGGARPRTDANNSHVMPALGRDAADRMGNALWD
jgi:integrase